MCPTCSRSKHPFVNTTVSPECRHSATRIFIRSASRIFSAEVIPELGVNAAINSCPCNRHRTDLTHHDPSRKVRKIDPCVNVQPSRKACGKRRNHGVPGTGDVENLPRSCGRVVILRRIRHQDANALLTHGHRQKLESRARPTARCAAASNSSVWCAGIPVASDSSFRFGQTVVAPEYLPQVPWSSGRQAPEYQPAVKRGSPPHRSSPSMPLSHNRKESRHAPFFTSSSARTSSRSSSSAG